jgi:hypothetical protein
MTSVSSVRWSRKLERLVVERRRLQTPENLHLDFSSSFILRDLLRIPGHMSLTSSPEHEPLMACLSVDGSICQNRPWSLLPKFPNGVMLFQTPRCFEEGLQTKP